MNDHKRPPRLRFIRRSGQSGLVSKSDAAAIGNELIRQSKNRDFRAGILAIGAALGLEVQR
jgi:hypothetical protein